MKMGVQKTQTFFVLSSILTEPQAKNAYLIHGCNSLLIYYNRLRNHQIQHSLYLSRYITSSEISLSVKNSYSVFNGTCKMKKINCLGKGKREAERDKGIWVRFLVLSKALQLFRERLSEKMCSRQYRKVIWDMIDTLFLTTVAVEPTFATFC